MQTPVETSYKNLERASEHILKLLSEVIGVNTLFIAVNDGNTNFILKAFNRHEALTEAGSILPLFETYCGLVTLGAADSVIVPSTQQSPLTNYLGVTQQLGDTSFIGVPIMLKDQTVCGTICGLDNHGYAYSERDVDLLKTMATFLGYVVELESIAFRDDLTEAFNRNFIHLYLTENWRNRFEAVAFLFVDIDNFKALNDTYGHTVGDNILIETVKRIQRCVRKTDIVCRVGGDEFVVVIPEYGQTTTLTRNVENVLAEFVNPIRTDKADIYASISIGVSMYPQDGQDVDQLLKNADDAMYRVKQNGKGSFQLFHTLPPFRTASKI